MAAPNLSEILTVSMAAMGDELRDNVSDSNAVLFRLREKGHIRKFSGGERIREELDYGENGNAQWISGAEQFGVGATETFSAAEFEIKQLIVSAVINGREKLQNSGKAKIMDLMEARVVNAKRTMKNKLAYGIHSDGTAFGAKIITGLLATCPTTPTAGTYGGITRGTATTSFWHPYYLAATTSASNILEYMTLAKVSLTRGTDTPDLILQHDNEYKKLLAALQGLQQFTNPKMAEAGFTTVKFMGADVVLDGGIGGNMTASHSLFLNTDFLWLRPHADCDMVPLSPDPRSPHNQDVHIAPLAWAGNLTCGGNQFQGRHNGA